MIIMIWITTNIAQTSKNLYKLKKTLLRMDRGLFLYIFLYLTKTFRMDPHHHP